MKTKYLLPFIQLAISLLFIVGCSKSADPISTETESMPTISSLSSDKAEILYGGTDQAILTCAASGGNLNYVWQVDLGDVVPMSKDHSKVSFTGAACCVGDKVITCVVSNSKGSISKSITLKILEEIKAPEILTFDADKTVINSAIGEKSHIVCYAIGGNLKYLWQSSCGDISVDQSDNSKITYSPGNQCGGLTNIKCTVSNEKGITTKNIMINVN